MTEPTYRQTMSNTYQQVRADFEKLCREGHYPDAFEIVYRAAKPEPEKEAAA